MLANPTETQPATIRRHGLLFGEIIADLVNSGQPITEVLTEILAFGPISLREAIYVARFLQSNEGDPIVPEYALPHFVSA